MLITLYKEQNEYFQKEIEKQPKEKKKEKRKKFGDSKESEESINLEIENLLKEISEDNDSESNSNKNKLTISNSSSSKEESENIYDNKENINKKKGFKWYKNSCSFDSFISIFIYSILPNIKHIVNNKNEEKNFTTDFELYLKFINHIIDKNENKEIIFYKIYENFNKENGVNLFNL